MARGPLISNKTRSLIYEIYQRDTKQLIKEIHYELGKILGNRAPGLSAVQKELAKIKRKKAEMPKSPLDEQWSIGSLIRYNFPTEIIKIIIEVKKILMRSENQIQRESLTIRRALWISRLYQKIIDCYVRHYSSELYDLNKTPINTASLWIVLAITGVYESIEKTCEILDMEIDTFEVDSVFFISEYFWDLPDADKVNIAENIHRITFDNVMREWSHSKDNKRKAENNIFSSKSE